MDICDRSETRNPEALRIAREPLNCGFSPTIDGQQSEARHHQDIAKNQAYLSQATHTLASFGSSARILQGVLNTLVPLPLGATSIASPVVILELERSRAVEYSKVQAAKPLVGANPKASGSIQVNMRHRGTRTLVIWPEPDGSTKAVVFDYVDPQLIYLRTTTRGGRHSVQARVGNSLVAGVGKSSNRGRYRLRRQFQEEDEPKLDAVSSPEVGAEEMAVWDFLSWSEDLIEEAQRTGVGSGHYRA